MNNRGRVVSAWPLVAAVVFVFGALLIGFSCLPENNYFDAGMPSMVFEKHLYENPSGDLTKIPDYNPDVFRWKGILSNSQYWVDFYLKETRDGNFVYLIVNRGSRDCHVKTGFLTWITGRKKHHLPAKSALVISVEKLPAARAGIVMDLVEVLEPRGWGKWFTIYPTVLATYVKTPVPETFVEEGGR